MENQKYYSLYPHCFIVKGKDKNIIFNAQHKSITFITPDIISFMESFGTYSTLELKDIYKNRENNYLSIIDFLKKRHLIFERQNNDIFTPINYDYESPEYITHMVIEYSEEYDLNMLINAMDKMLTKYLELRFINPLSSKDYNKIRNYLTTIYNTTIRSIQIVANYENLESLLKIVNQKDFSYVINSIFYNSPYNGKNIIGNKAIWLIKQSYDITKSMNNSYQDELVLNLRFFIEAHYRNPYYNKRLCIDRYGNIMNCLKNKRIFGNINDSKLEDIITHTDFRELWHVTPDMITNIRDNPLRYNMFITNDLIKVNDNSYSLID